MFIAPELVRAIQRDRLHEAEVHRRTRMAARRFSLADPDARRRSRYRRIRMPGMRAEPAGDRGTHPRVRPHISGVLEALRRDRPSGSPSAPIRRVHGSTPGRRRPASTAIGGRTSDNPAGDPDRGTAVVRCVEDHDRRHRTGKSRRRIPEVGQAEDLAIDYSERGT
jgi:hypothetical protein